MQLVHDDKEDVNTFAVIVGRASVPLLQRDVNHRWFGDLQAIVRQVCRSFNTACTLTLCRHELLCEFAS
jgi:hypothetical protein